MGEAAVSESQLTDSAIQRSATITARIKGLLKSGAI